MKLPNVGVLPDTVPLMGGMDRLGTSMTVKPGSASWAYNYEAVFGGGFERVGGIERFDGRPRPSDATYVAFAAADAFTMAVGDTVTGLSSSATGVCIYVTPSLVVLTKVVGTFASGEALQVGGITSGTSSAADPGITPAQDNTYRALAAALYSADITEVPGRGRLRGVSVLKGTVYAWRNHADLPTMVLYKSTTAGWEAIDLGSSLSFTAGLPAGIADGAAITGAVSGATGTVARVVLEAGTFASSTAAGKLILSASTGTFQAAEFITVGGTNRATASGAATAITMTESGRVLTDLWNFTASTDTQKIYGCDGVNPEFEFDGTVYVPLNTGQTVRATTVRCHKNHVFFGFRGSVQHSGIADPYKFTAISGASELGTGDVVTGLIPVAGSEDRAALLVLCQDSTWVLFGNDSTAWQFTPLSREAGGNAYSAEDCGSPMVHDTAGMRKYKPTQDFGNFQWDLESRLIEERVQNKIPRASCFTKAYSRYRVFFTDGSAISGTPGPKGWEWTILKYDRAIHVAHSCEVDGVTRTFYGDSLGFVYEADVGRSFDGDNIFAVLRLHGLHQQRPMAEKTYRYGVLETIGRGPFTLNVAAEFNDQDSSKEITPSFSAQLSGLGAQWASGLWDQVFWDEKRLDRRRVAIEGSGYNCSPVFFTDRADELPHQIKTITLVYTPRRIARL